MNDITNIVKGSCILRINGVYDSLKNAEKRLADFILANTDSIDYTIFELAARSETSYATISRFCRKIGFSGFKEFKKNLESNIIDAKSLEEEMEGLTISTHASIGQVSEVVLGLSSKLIEELKSIIDYEAISAVAEKIIKSNSICFIGAGTSGISARYAYSKFFRIGIPSYYEADSTLFKMKASVLNKDDILFVISSSGRTAEVIKCAKMAKNNNVYVVSLSDFAISPLTKVSNANLYTTPRDANLFRNIDMPFIIGQIIIIDILYSCCYLKMGENSSRLFNKTKLSADSEKLK